MEVASVPQVTVLFSAFEGLTVAFNVTKEPTSSFFALKLRLRA